jgi:hypothetical protein
MGSSILTGNLTEVESPWTGAAAGSGAGGFFELLSGPNAIGIDLKRLRKRLLRFSRLIGTA